MAQHSPEEDKAVLQTPPKGTWALMLLVAGGFLVVWLVLYFGFFLAHGPVN